MANTKAVLHAAARLRSSQTKISLWRGQSAQKQAHPSSFIGQYVGADMGQHFGYHRPLPRQSFCRCHTRNEQAGLHGKENVPEIRRIFHRA